MGLHTNSRTHIENTIIRDIKINSNSLIGTYNNHEINISNVEFSEIFCYGDKSSILNFNGNEIESLINIRNLKIFSCISNGPLIKINGNENEITIMNTYLYNNTLYGSIFENNSKKVF